MEINQILDYIAPAATGVVGWFAGSRKRKNDFLAEMQNSIDILSKANKDYVSQIVSFQKLEIKISALESDNEMLKQENDVLKAKVEVLETRLNKR